MTTSFDDWVFSNQQAMEDALSAYLPSSQQKPERLHQAMRYTTLDGGKRVRPLLVFAAGALFDANHSLLIRAATAVEMIHVYSLVHDDMPCMDDDALRRGKPTVHVKYDDATALLVGDALQAQAFSVLSESNGNPASILAMVRLLAHAAGSAGMCAGQAIDLASIGIPLSLPDLEQMHRLKTGAILRASVFLGAMCGKVLTPEEVFALEAYSRAVGLAFQVVDDILDATADSVTLGKTAGKDAADNKPTYVSILGLEKSQELAEELREKAHAVLAPFSNKAERLHQIADLVVRRKT